MKPYRFMLWWIYCLHAKNRGSALPIALVVGLIAALVGTLMLAESFRDRTDIVTRQSASSSEALAELGVTRSLDRINSFRAIASVPACGGSWNTSGQCTDNTNPSWFTVSNPVPTGTYRLDNLISDLTKPAKTLLNNTTVTAADIPSCIPITVNATTVSGFANQVWQDAFSDPKDGQFRLIDYNYNAVDSDNRNDGTGTLTVEGRIGQGGSGSTATATAQTGTARLQVQFPVQLEPPWGLWIQTGLTAATGVRVNADVRHSGCGQTASDINDFRTTNQGSSWKYAITPDKLFGPSPDPPVVAPADQSPSLSISTGITTLTAAGSPYHYQIDNVVDKNSMVISGMGRLRANAPGQRVEIVLPGNLRVKTSNPTQEAIEVTEGTTLVIYVAGSVIIEQNSLLKNHDNNRPSNFQLYHTGASGVITLSSNTNIDNAFIFAPNTTLTQQNTSQIRGTMWLGSWVGQDSAEFTQGPDPLLSTLMIIVRRPTGSPITTLEDISLNRIGNNGRLSSWRRCSTSGC